jgi:hypothetical protein
MAEKKWFQRFRRVLYCTISFYAASELDKNGSRNLEEFYVAPFF